MVFRDKDTNVGNIRSFAMQDANFSATRVLTLIEATNTWIAERYVNDPYGKFVTYDDSWTLAAGQVAFQHHHQGLMYNDLTGLYWNRNRDYSQSQQRFIQQDPMGYVDGANIYAYQRARVPNTVDAGGTILRLITLEGNVTFKDANGAKLEKSKREAFQHWLNELAGEGKWMVGEDGVVKSGVDNFCKDCDKEGAFRESKHPASNRLICVLVTSEKTVKVLILPGGDFVTRGADENGFNGTGSDSQVALVPSKTLQFKTGDKWVDVPLYIVMAHEFAHAEEYSKGTAKKDANGVIDEKYAQSIERMIEKEHNFTERPAADKDIRYVDTWTGREFNK